LRVLENCQRAVEQQEIVIHLAAHVGGIGLNQVKPAQLFYDNLIMGAQLIHAAYQAGVENLSVLVPICAYPKFTKVPFKEDDLGMAILRKPMPYGVAKSSWFNSSLPAAVRLQWHFLLPVNLYGPEDNFDQ